VRSRILAVVAAFTTATCAPVNAPSPSSLAHLPTPAPAAGGTWTAVDLPDAVGGWRANGVIADADGFVVYGSVNNRPAAWTSTDGTSWSSVALAGFNLAPTSAAASANATVLLGVGSTDRCAHPSGEFLWRRAAGIADWQAVPFDEQLFCAGGFAHIAASDDAFAVVGMGTGDQPFAWQSADGGTWRDAAVGIPFEAPPSLITATDGSFLEGGRGESTDVRASVDGKTWSAVKAPPVPPAFNPNGQGMSPAAIVSTGAGTIAIYESDDTSILSAWHRELDSTWTEVRLSGLEPGDAVGQGTTTGGQPYLFAQRQARAILLTSSDLASWTAVVIPDLTYALGIAAVEDHRVLVGSVTDAAGDEHSLVYVADAAP
jgi:hypothetical protein